VLVEQEVGDRRDADVADSSDTHCLELVRQDKRLD
jgi:hypothetical protein